MLWSSPVVNENKYPGKKTLSSILVEGNKLHPAPQCSKQISLNLPESSITCYIRFVTSPHSQFLSLLITIEKQGFNLKANSSEICFALGKSLGHRAFPIPPSFWWSTNTIAPEFTNVCKWWWNNWKHGTMRSFCLQMDRFPDFQIWKSHPDRKAEETGSPICPFKCMLKN